jgi:uncharacterized SAM-binding protein YcdF (DUF218 family)
MKFKLILLITALALILAGAGFGQFLVLDAPRKSDVIVILAGETDRRLTRGLELLDQGYAPRLILDVPAQSKIYLWSQTELARKYVAGLPQASFVTICDVYGQSTRGEVEDVVRCLGGLHNQKILLVTSDYHTRRALSIFRRAAPADYSVAAAFDAREFGVDWWRHREWAKTTVEECAKLLWWESVDRWR